MADKSETMNLKIDTPILQTILQGLDELPHKLARPVYDEIVKQVKTFNEGAKEAVEGAVAGVEDKIADDIGLDDLK